MHLYRILFYHSQIQKNIIRILSLLYFNHSNYYQNKSDTETWVGLISKIEGIWSIGSMEGGEYRSSTKTFLWIWLARFPPTFPQNRYIIYCHSFQHPLKSNSFTRKVRAYIPTKRGNAHLTQLRKELTVQVFGNGGEKIKCIMLVRPLGCKYIRFGKKE
jgi:hypothetical protein